MSTRRGNDVAEAHPLFLPETEDDTVIPAAQINKIYVKRFERTGGATQAPRGYGPAELRDETVLHEMFGGGSYELFARSSTGQILGRSTLLLPGKSKPLDGAYVEEEEAPAATSAPQQQTVPAGGFDPMQLMMMMMQMQAQSSKETIAMMMQMQQAQAQAQAQQTQILVAALSGGDKQSTALMQAFSPILTQALGRDRGNPVDDARRIVDLAKDLAVGSEIVEEPNDDQNLLSTIGQVMQGAAALQQANAQRPAPAQPLPPPPLRAVGDPDTSTG